MIEYFEDQAKKLAILNDRQRLQEIIQRGNRHEGLPADEQTDEYKVEGCQSNAYIKVEADDTVTVKSAADSTVVSGYLSYLQEGLSGKTPSQVREEAEGSVTHFVDQGDLSSTFTPNRSDVFTNAVEAIANKLD